MTPTIQKPKNDLPPVRFGLFSSAIFWTAIVFLSCFSIRAYMVLRSDFPMGDGGLFYQMSEDLVTNGYKLPKFTSYNNEQIPFAYSPLPFYLAAFTNGLLGISMVQVFRILPLIGSCLILFAFYRLASALTANRVFILTATFLYGCLPRSFIWMVMGGGLNRSFGLAFALLATRELYLLAREPRLVTAVMAGVFTGLTALCHLGTLPVIVWSGLVFYVFFARRWKSLTGALIAAGVAGAMVAPWILAVAAQHGLEPFRAAQTTSELNTLVEQLRSILFEGTATAEERSFQAIGSLAFFGLLVCLNPKDLYLPAWWLALSIFVPRGGATYTAPLVALLAAVASVEHLIPGLRKRWEEVAMPAGWKSGWLAIPAAFSLFVFVSAVAFFGKHFQTLSAETRSSFAWVKQSTPPDSRFLILSDLNSNYWQQDRAGEWFPALTERTSVATPQGYEWKKGAFDRRVNALIEMRKCAEIGLACLERWTGAEKADYQYLLVEPRDPEPVLVTELKASRTYQMVHENRGLYIWKKVASGRP